MHKSVMINFDPALTKAYTYPAHHAANPHQPYLYFFMTSTLPKKLEELAEGEL